MEEFNNKLFVIDKAVGPTSFAVVAAFKSAARLRKVGHTGTLDPLAQGVLLLCTGTATRAVEHFMNLEKEYQFDVCLGVETDTLDREGRVVREAPCPDLPKEEILAAARSFVGEYELTPPAYSALKHNGRRLYEMARAGESPVVPNRKVRIYDFEVVSIELPVVTCRIRCSRGTYVRSLAKDLGGKLGVPAHIDCIARNRIGPFKKSQGFPSQRLFDREIDDLNGIDLAGALDFLPGVVLEERARKALRYGTLPAIKDVVESFGDVKRGGPVRILDEGGTLVAIGERNLGKRKHPLQLVDSFRLYTDLGSGKGARKGR
jgi:tRNA pseudouridine55 synthase